MQRSERRWSERASVAASVVLLAAACRRSPIDAGALQVRADVTPHELSASAHPDGAEVEVVVSVTNPRYLPVIVRLGGPPDKRGSISAAQTHGIGFGVRVLAADRAIPGGPSMWMSGPPTVILGPRATRRQTFVVPVATADSAGGVRVTPGAYRVVASFGRQEAPPVTLRVRP